VGRCLPVVRTFVSIVAGFSQMPALLFGVLSFIGTAVWVTAISLIGYSLSSTWQSIAHGIAVAGYAIAAVAVIAIAAFVMYRLREFRKEAALDNPAVTGPATGAPTSGGPAASGRRGPRHSRTVPQDSSRTASQETSGTASQDTSRTAPQDDQPRPRSPMS
jgi:hypothetical protein